MAILSQTQQSVIHCVFGPLSVIASMKFLSKLCDSSATVGLDLMGYPLLPMSTNEPCTCDPVTGSLLVLPWTTYGSYLPLHTRNTSQDQRPHLQERLEINFDIEYDLSIKA